MKNYLVVRNRLIEIGSLGLQSLSVESSVQAINHLVLLNLVEPLTEILKTAIEYM